MKESEYSNVRNLSQVIAAQDVLRGVVPKSLPTEAHAGLYARVMTDLQALSDGMYYEIGDLEHEEDS